MDFLGFMSDDVILYGGGCMVLLLLYFALGSKDKKVENRLARASGLQVIRAENITSQRSLRKIEKKDKIFLISLFTCKEKGFVPILRNRLMMAGFEVSAEKYIAINLGIMAFMVIFLSLILQKPIILGVLCGLVVGVGIPHFLVSRKIKKRQKAFLLSFPDAIDLIVRGLRSGLPVTQSMQNIAQEIVDPVKSIFRDITDQVALGMNFDDALNLAAKKLNLTEFDFFITSIILQKETGGNLGEILSNLSEVLRSRQMMKMKIKAMSAEAKASAIIVGSLPFFVFGVLNFISPAYISVLYTDFRGNIALIGALGSIGLGSFIMAKMSNFEI